MIPIPSNLPRRVASYYRQLEGAYAAFAVASARDQRSSVARRNTSQAFRRLERTRFDVLASLGVRIVWDGEMSCAYLPEAKFDARPVRAMCEAWFPGYTDKGNEAGDRVAAERRRRNGAKVRATRARNAARRNQGGTRGR